MSTKNSVVRLVSGRELIVSGRALRTARLRSEFHVPLGDPMALIQEVRQSRTRADLLTFVQDLDDRSPRYDYYQEAESLAALPLSTYDHWFSKQLYFKPRNKLRKALKSGIEIRLEGFSEPLVQGIKGIYDETPIRQGKRNYHYEEDLDTIRRDHSTFLDRSQFITAYYDGEMIGFAKVTFSQGCGVFMNFLSKVSHRDKAVNNAILAKAVEVCAERGSTCLVYGVWGGGGTRGLMEFKETNGFERVDLPRYFVPMSLLGRLALKIGVHRGLVHRLPESALVVAAKIRMRWNSLRFRVGRT
jgi:hypothetical protein